jgi:hypothetical protein
MFERKECASPSERIRVEKLRRYSTFVISLKGEHRSFVSRKVRAGVASAGLESKVLRRNT